MPAYDVLVVDDSVFMRKMISDFITSDPEFRVVATAKNGKEAVELIKKHRPRAVTMDIEMPEMNGLEALRIVMREQPTPVIMLSSLTQEGAAETIKALEWGAFDFVGKPSGSISLDLHKVKDLLLEKLRAAVKSNAKKFADPVFPVSLKNKLTTPTLAKQTANQHGTAGNDLTRFEHLVAIGTSTGGPRALHKVLSELPSGFPAPIVIVQHMPPGFTKSLAQRLDSVSQIRVVEAEEGMRLESSTAYVAPGGYHLTVARSGPQYKIHLSHEQPRGGHRPSVDVMFESLLPLKELKRHIVIMTGMGSDGAKGMLALKQSGALTTIAESEETCIVYGMPRAAVELQCVTDIVPQQSIARKLATAVFQS
ncbi:chemotaxis response regulator protein-glutamate methylesterase [Paenibacillus sp. GD4]|jgi:two-component system, chemotaxis family, protein-glutamate methylesterase/glutaminase|uniref:protein-glutamate methylesterase/protein-glutamine glutaminase n=1 Tax=Paenibacillus sp. GD4 TaxID=3068890 RepID=UPI002796838F|nr:chemotaxis response regulator protein-glutamate methylesterase [Paenibacillus sp. GD4]MDQ1913328.1 chemotaxis response regulator protein-glutamate methylesterase [Paenibacillus sp. GD4]